MKQNLRHEEILTPQLKKEIHAAVQAASYEGHAIDQIAFDYDRATSLFSDTLTPEEYKLFSPAKAEAVIASEIKRQALESGKF
jgi:hypothetical protein